MSVIQIDPPVSYRAAELEDLIQKGELLPGVSLNQSQKEFLTTEAFRIFLAMNLLSTEAEKVKRTTFTMPIMQHVRWDKEGVINTSAYLVRHAARFGPIYMDGTEGQHRSDPYPDGKKQAIWQGMTIWTDELVRKGVPKDKILYTGPAYNTPDEHNEMIKLAIAEQWKDVVIIGNSYQMLRIALGTVQIMKKNNYWLRCYFVVPETGDWFVPMKGPQGSDDGPRLNQLWQEYLRIPEYQLKGDLCTLNELIRYITFGRDSVENGKLTQSIDPEV